MIIFAREDDDLGLQESTRADEQAGGDGGVERRDEHLENMSLDLSAARLQSARQRLRCSGRRAGRSVGGVAQGSQLRGGISGPGGEAGRSSLAARCRSEPMETHGAAAELSRH